MGGWVFFLKEGGFLTGGHGGRQSQQSESKASSTLAGVFSDLKGEGLGGDLVQGGSEMWAHPSWPRQAREGATGQRSHLGRAVQATDRGAGPCAPRLRSGPFPVRLCLC